MNIALSSLIIITLLLPGILFRTFIIKSDSFENPLDTSIKAEIGFILLLSLIIHTIGLIVCEYVFKLNFHIDQLYYLLIADKDKIDLNIIKKSTYFTIVYLFSQIIVCSLVAIYLKKEALKRFWDFKTPFFPITSEWDNILSGRYYLYERNKELTMEKAEVSNKIKELEKFIKKSKDAKKGKEILDNLKTQRSILDAKIDKSNMVFVKIDALTDFQDELILYRGTVYEYFLSKKNQLDKITLYNSFRRLLYPEQDSEKEFYEFNSNMFVIDYENIKNLNIRYWFAVETEGTPKNVLENTTQSSSS